MTSPMTLTVLEALRGATLIGPLTLNDVIVNGDTTLNGNATVNGDITATGTIQGDDIIATDDFIGAGLVITGSSTLADMAATTGNFSGLLTTNGQIHFPAVQNPSADPNTLDDYEEGTWTPTLTFVTPGNLSVVYGTRVGWYTKIGNLVTLSWSIITTTWTHTTASGNLTLSGVPFTADSLGNMQQTGVLSTSGLITGSGTFWTNRILALANTIEFIGNSTIGSGRIAATTAHATTGTQQVSIGSVSYRTAT